MIEVDLGVGAGVTSIIAARGSIGACIGSKGVIVIHISTRR